MRKFSNVVSELVWASSVGGIFIGILTLGMQDANAARGWFKPVCAADSIVCTRTNYGDCNADVPGTPCDTVNGDGCACKNVNQGGLLGCGCL